MKIGKQQVSGAPKWRAIPAPESDDSSRRASTSSQSGTTTTECTTASLEQATAGLTLADDYVPGPNLLEALPAELFSEIISFVYCEHLLILPYGTSYYGTPLRNRKVFAANEYPELIFPLLVNKRCASEGSQALYRNVTVYFRASTNEWRLFHRLGSVNLANIRSIEVCYPGSNRKARETSEKLSRVAEHLPNVSRLRVHIDENQLGSESPYLHSVRDAFYGHQHLTELSVEHYRVRKDSALCWISSKPFTSGEIQKMLDTG
ncbi:hypothetical protein LTR95_019556, partial [Oleoguttula sp. CCFEE 5521]